MPDLLTEDLLDNVAAFWGHSFEAGRGEQLVARYVGEGPGTYASPDGGIAGDARFKANLLTTNQAGSLNYVYGLDVTTYVYRELNLKMLLPHVPWPDWSGYRVEKTDPTSLGSTVDEDGSVPASIDPPDLGEVSTEPAFMMTAWNISDVLDFRYKHDGDSLRNAEDFHRDRYARRHALLWEKSYARDAAGPATGATANTTEARVDDNDAAKTGTPGALGKKAESIDRVIGNKDLANNRSNAKTGWYDLEGVQVDRDSTTDNDAYVDHNSGVNRNFTLKMLDDLETAVENKGARWQNGFLVMRRDTLQVIKREFQSFHRAKLDEASVTVTVNGVSTYQGKGPNLRVATYDDCPMFPDMNLPADGIGRIYYVYPEDIEVLQGLPPMYLQANDKLLIGGLRTKYAYLAVEQLRARRFNRMGKIMDLKAAS